MPRSITVSVLNPQRQAVVSNTVIPMNPGDVEKCWKQTTHDFRTQFPNESLMADEGQPGYVIQVA